MAGDWIKVEVETPRKAEVLRIAEMLGISRRECMGLLVDYWAWLDANARTEFVPNLSRICLDSVLHCPGLAACLEAVGWASWSDDGWTMAVHNYSVHNGSSAKTRAYEQRKKKIQREAVPVLSRICPDDMGTREEKRREEYKKQERSPTKARKRATPIPDDFKISERVSTWAAEKGYTKLDQHLEAFLGKCRAKGYTYQDWDAAFMNCIREDWGKVNTAKVVQIPDKHGSHVAARLPDVGQKTEMPQAVRDVFAKLKFGA